MNEKKLGFIGVGDMGFGMVKNLQQKGFSVVAYDRDLKKTEPLVAEGATQAQNIAQIATTVETVILCLPHPSISKEVIFGDNGLMQAGSTITTIIDASTLTPEDSTYFFSELQKRNMHFLSSPMRAGKQMALDGQIQFLVEGEKEIVDTNMDIFLAMGPVVDYMGLPPHATLTKLAYNLCRYSNVATALEVMRLLHAYTDNIEPIYRVLREGSLDNFGQVWASDMKKVVLEHTPYNPTGIPEKDLTLIIDMAKKEGISEALFESIRNVYRSLKKT